MATYDEVLSTTTTLLRRHVPVTKTILPEQSIQGDLGLDSLAVMELVADAEERFSISIPNELLMDLVTVDDVVKAIVRLAK